MRLEELLDGSPAGCVGVDDMLIDPKGMLWVRGDAEVFGGEPAPDHPYRIRRTRTVGLVIKTCTLGHSVVLEVPEEDIKRRPPRMSPCADVPGWLPVTLRRTWEQRRS
ncbi:hypothetical protein V5E97_35425 [Singulisphaera sp. Ch08]|uniref:Uncharacterized protein n=1 Tax=Singulisphaera sp. Ch08 TaxID=3120278 RepID=A0AAU7CDY6_9BACT